MGASRLARLNATLARAAGEPTGPSRLGAGVADSIDLNTSECGGKWQELVSELDVPRNERCPW